MNLPLLIQGVGSIGVFSSRAFLPAFATALALRFGPEIAWVDRLGLFRDVRGVPTWFTRDATLIGLGVLSALELAAERVPEAREVYAEVVHALKAIMAALTYLGVLSATDLGAIGGAVRVAGLLDPVPALVVGAGTFAVSRARAGFVGLWEHLDVDDALGLRRLVRRLEDAWSLLGPISLLAFPIVTLGLLAVAAAALVRLRSRAEASREAARVPCEGCGRAIDPSALACPVCGTEAESPRAVGWLGQAEAGPVVDRAPQPYRLFAAGRCPNCATRLRGRSASTVCGACGRKPLDGPAFVGGYASFLDRRVPWVCVACFLMGLVPVLGAVAGVLTYRTAIVGPLRRYLPAGRGLAVRWRVRVACLALLAFQWVPILGAFTIPAMALINYSAYRKAFCQIKEC